MIGNDCFGRVRPIPSGWTGPIGEDWDPNEELHSFKRLSRCLLQYSERWFLSNPELSLTHSHSFYDYCSFELSNLHILDIGENCFYNAVSFILAGWCNNTSVLLRLWCVFFVGYASSYSCQTIAFESQWKDFDRRLASAPHHSSGFVCATRELEWRSEAVEEGASQIPEYHDNEKWFYLSSWMIRSSIAIRIQRGNMKLRMCGYSDSGEQGIGVHAMEMSLSHHRMRLDAIKYYRIPSNTATAASITDRKSVV